MKTSAQVTLTVVMQVHAFDEYRSIESAQSEAAEKAIETLNRLISNNYGRIVGKPSVTLVTFGPDA